MNVDIFTYDDDLGNARTNTARIRMKKRSVLKKLRESFNRKKQRQLWLLEHELIPFLKRKSIEGDHSDTTFTDAIPVISEIKKEGRLSLRYTLPSRSHQKELKKFKKAQKKQEKQRKKEIEKQKKEDLRLEKERRKQLEKEERAKQKDLKYKLKIPKQEQQQLFPRFQKNKIDTAQLSRHEVLSREKLSQSSSDQSYFECLDKKPVNLEQWSYNTRGIQTSNQSQESHVTKDSPSYKTVAQLVQELENEKLRKANLKEMEQRWRKKDELSEKAGMQYEMVECDIGVPATSADVCTIEYVAETPVNVKDECVQNDNISCQESQELLPKVRDIRAPQHSGVRTTTKHTQKLHLQHLEIENLEKKLSSVCEREEKALPWIENNSSELDLANSSFSKLSSYAINKSPLSTDNNSYHTLETSNTRSCAQGKESARDACDQKAISIPLAKSSCSTVQSSYVSLASLYSINVQLCPEDVQNDYKDATSTSFDDILPGISALFRQRDYAIRAKSLDGTQPFGMLSTVRFEIPCDNEPHPRICWLFYNIYRFSWF